LPRTGRAFRSAGRASRDRARPPCRRAHRGARRSRPPSPPRRNHGVACPTRPIGTPRPYPRTRSVRALAGKVQANAIAPLAAADPLTPQSTDASQAAPSAFGLGFDALLKIILTQLTYQDPLKPMDNFEFVSQLAQFSQIQQGQTTNDRLESL